METVFIATHAPFEDQYLDEDAEIQVLENEALLSNSCLTDEHSESETENRQHLISESTETAPTFKQPRRLPTQAWQYDVYLEYVAQHPQLLYESTGIDELYSMWKVLASKLNHATAGAPTRKIDEWRQSFRNWKNALSYKKRKFDSGDTSQLPSGKWKYKPTDLEERALFILAGKTVDKQNNKTDVEHVEAPTKQTPVVISQQPIAAKTQPDQEANKTPALPADKLKMANESNKSVPTQSAQFQLYLRYVAKYPYLVNGDFHVDQHIRSVHLADKLNALGGAKKTTDEWKSTFKNWKNNVLYKARRIAEQQTNGGESTHRPLTKLEERALLAWRGEDVSRWRKDSSYEDSSDEARRVATVKRVRVRRSNKDPKIGRCRRTIPQQYELFMRHVDKHSELLTGAASTYELNQLWKKIAAELNTYPTGPVKSPYDWHKTFIMWKNSLSYKARKLSDEGKTDQLSVLESRALAAWKANPCENKYVVAEDGLVYDNDSQDEDDDPMSEMTSENTDVLDEDWVPEHPEKKPRKMPYMSVQYELFIEHVSVHPQLITNSGDPATYQLLWLRLVTALNRNGQTKTITEWRAVFHEWKKAVTLKKQLLQTSDYSGEPLTDLEQRALKIFSRIDFSADDASASRKATLIRLHSCQFAMLIKYATKHPEVRTGLGDPGVFNRLWDEMADKLNAFRVGPIRTVATWKNTFWLWRRSLLSKLRKYKGSAGGAEPVACKLTDFERQAIELFVGRNCISIGAMGRIVLNGTTNLPSAAEPKTLYDCCDKNGDSQATNKTTTLIQVTRCECDTHPPETQPPVFVAVNAKPAVRRADSNEIKNQRPTPTLVKNTADKSASADHKPQTRRVSNNKMASTPIHVADQSIKPEIPFVNCTPSSSKMASPASVSVERNHQSQLRREGSKQIKPEIPFVKRTPFSSKMVSPASVSVEHNPQSQLRREGFRQMACSLGAVADRIGDLAKGVADSNALMRTVLQNQEKLLQKLLDR